MQNSTASRPLGITTLAILATLAGVAHLIGALQDFGVMPAVGDANVGFFVANPLAGAVQFAAALVSLGMAYGLWTERAWARKAVMAVAMVNIGITIATQAQSGEPWWSALPGVLLNTAILLYARTPTVCKALDR